MDMEHLHDALVNLIDMRLQEHGLLEDPAEKKKAAPGKAAKGKAAEADEITLDTLKDKITTLVNKKGKDEAKALLKKAKVDKLSELAEKHYAKFNELLDEAIGAEADDDLFGD